VSHRGGGRHYGGGGRRGGHHVSHRGGGRHYGGGGRRGGGGRGGGRRSDIRLKEDIVPLGQLNNGLELYRFRYKGGDRTTYVGVMAQEVQKIKPDAVWREHSGYLMVNYDRLGLKFMTWKEWLGRGGGAGRRQ
jgi:Chaperone of endosialidase